VHGVIIVYDVTDRVTFFNVNQWAEEISRYASASVSILIVGNKCDLVAEREVDFATAKEQFDEWRISFLETSVVDHTNVDEAFAKIASEILIKEEGENETLHGMPLIEIKVKEEKKSRCILM
jgi:Ras-related protein Rab-1A